MDEWHTRQVAKRIWRAVGGGLWVFAFAFWGGQGDWGNPSMPPRQALGTYGVSDFMTNYTGTECASAGKARRLSASPPRRLRARPMELCGLYLCSLLYFRLAPPSPLVGEANFCCLFAFSVINEVMELAAPPASRLWGSERVKPRIRYLVSCIK